MLDSKDERQMASSWRLAVPRLLGALAGTRCLLQAAKAGGRMRNRFHEQLDELGEMLVTMAAAATTAIQRANWALLSGDSESVELVHDTALAISAQFRRIENLTFLLLARQQPVASDLRLIIVGQHAAADLDRMGQLASHIAKIAQRNLPDGLVRVEGCAPIREMATVAEQIAAKATEAIRGRDAVLAADLERDDDQIDALHRRLWATLLGGWQDGTEAAIDAALLGRFYERYADHAVNAARQVVYLITGHA
jgi:phosphate transport system protein